MHQVRSKIPGSNGTLVSYSNSADGYWRDDELVSYHDDTDGDEWDFADAHDDSHDYVIASVLEDLDVVRELRGLANAVMLQDAT